MRSASRVPGLRGRRGGEAGHPAPIPLPSGAGRLFRRCAPCPRVPTGEAGRDRRCVPQAMAGRLRADAAIGPLCRRACPTRFCFLLRFCVRACCPSGGPGACRCVVAMPRSGAGLSMVCAGSFSCAPIRPKIAGLHFIPVRPGSIFGARCPADPFAGGPVPVVVASAVLSSGIGTACGRPLSTIRIEASAV